MHMLRLGIVKMNRLSWLGTLSSVAGSFLVAFGVMLAGYACFSLGSVTWLIVGFAKKDKPLVTLNGTFFIANLIGLYRLIYA